MVLSAIIVTTYALFQILVPAPTVEQPPAPTASASENPTDNPDTPDVDESTASPSQQTLERKEQFYTFLLAASDQVSGNSDTIMVASYDVPNQKVALVSIPRDTLVDAERTVKKINASYNVGGVEQVKKEVSNLLGIPIDYYIQECEHQDRIEHIERLQYSMVLDFCQRCADTHIPAGVSPDVYRSMMYIRNHTNESLSIEAVAAHVHRSPSYLMKHFKSELGVHMGAYITRCKLEEAKSLLAYSGKTLAEISSYLCFSSQPYFQNVFKKQYGLTPLAYRRQMRGGGQGLPPL